MARPVKNGLDYFPLDCDIDQDDKVMLVEASHGIVGFYVVIKLLMKIYKSGYFYEWTEREQLLFSKRINVDINKVNEIINDLVRWDFFQEEMFNKYKILTSKGIQLRYLSAVGRRQKVKMKQKYVLLDTESINVYKNLVIVDNNSINSYISTQSKVKESKVKESKEKEEISNSSSHLLMLYETLGFGLLNPYIADEINSLQEQYTSTWVEDALKQAMDQGKRKMSYVKGILKNWQSEGREEAKKDGKSKSSNSKQLIDEGIGLNLEDLS